MKIVSHNPVSDRSWQEALRTSLRSAEDLVREGLLREEDGPRYEPLLRKYQFLLPRYYAGLIDRSDPLCPIRRQAIPDLRELDETDHGFPDPLRDLEHQPASRITHRYRNRVLLHLTQNCSMYCRYCFRKTLLNDLRDELFAGPLRQALDYIAGNPKIEEVIFSGGDPFMAGNATIEQTLAELAQVPHLQRIRFHTRVPVTFPMRVDPELVEIFANAGRPVVVVTHFNHPRELTAQSREACAQLKAAGVTLLNQSVLLKGVNDSAEVLADLSRGLFQASILPYYLHHPDRARGTQHFDISPEIGKAIFRELRSELSGYLVPRYVIDRPDRPFKSGVGED